MYKVLFVLLVCIFSSGCAFFSRTIISYDHPEYGVVETTDKIYLDIHKLCEDEIYAIPVDVRGTPISSKKELDDIRREFEVYFGMTMHQRGIKEDWKVVQEYEKYMEKVPNFVHEIDELKREHSRCMQKNGFGRENRLPFRRG